LSVVETFTESEAGVQLPLTHVPWSLAEMIEMKLSVFITLEVRGECRVILIGYSDPEVR